MNNAYADLREGAKAACDEFVQAQYEGLYRWFHWLTSDPDRAADLAQETFVSFWHSLRRTVPTTTPRVWLFAIGRNVWRKHCRKRHRRKKEEDPAILDQTSSDEIGPYDVAEQREMAKVLADEVALLADGYREVFTLRVYQDLDYDEIAEIQGISRDLARWRFFRARQMVRARLKSWELQEHST